MRDGETVFESRSTEERKEKNQLNPTTREGN
jgi:hypothetical protein